MTNDFVKYRGFFIAYEPIPIGAKGMDWAWWHENYDAAIDYHDPREGRGVSEADCKQQIDEWIEENE